MILHPDTMPRVLRGDVRNAVVIGPLRHRMPLQPSHVFRYHDSPRILEFTTEKVKGPRQYWMMGGDELVMSPEIRIIELTCKVNWFSTLIKAYEDDNPRKWR